MKPLYVMLTLLMVGSLTGCALRSGADGRGPLRLPGDARAEASIGAPVPQNMAFSYGLLVVENDSNREIVVDEAELVGADPGIDLIGSYGVPTGSGIGFLAGFRPKGRELHRLKIDPHAQIQIILGLKVVSKGRHRFEKIALKYHAGNHQYRGLYGMSARLCSPVKTYVKKCPGLIG